MVEFLLRLADFAGTIVRLWRSDPDFRTLVILVFFTLLSGTIFYSLTEGRGLVDAFYFGKLFTIVYIFTGLGLIAGFITTIGTETLSSRTRSQGGDEEQGDSD